MIINNEHKLCRANNEHKLLTDFKNQKFLKLCALYTARVHDDCLQYHLCPDGELDPGTYWPRCERSNTDPQTPGQFMISLKLIPSPYSGV